MIKDISLNARVEKFISQPRKMLIDGNWVDSISEERTVTYNPSTGEAITSVPKANKEDVEFAVKAARRAFEEGAWPNMKPVERANLLLKLADLIEENAETISYLESMDNGAPISRTTRLPVNSANNLRYYAGWATKITGETIPVSTPGNIFNYTRREPIGVCVGIIPWNGPFMSAIMKISAPLAVGNTVIIKPASETPLSALFLGELIQEAGFPDGVVNIITGPGSTVGSALVEHPDVDKVAFTGSTEVGKQIMQLGASTIKKVTLELGGKSANIVFEDANYDTAIRNAANAIYFNSGQACFAGSRLFVERSIYDRFIQDLAEYTKTYRLGNSLAQDTDLGPLISANQKQQVLQYLEIGKKEGAEVVIGGEPTEEELSKGYFVKPTVVANVQNDMRIAQEEIFGPVVSAIPFDDIDEVIHLANQSIYGLGGGICTTNLSKAHRVAHAMRTGNVWINTYSLTDPASPFGGYKQSGLGRENGAASIDAYTEIKNVWIDLGK